MLKTLRRTQARCALLALGGVMAAGWLTGCNPGNGGGPIQDIVDSLPTVTNPEKIVFIRTSGLGGSTGQGAIWIMNPSGTEQKNLTPGPGDSQPVLSSKGQIAFIRGQQLWTMSSDGSNLQQRTGTSGLVVDFSAVADPVWRPDGQEITFAGLKRGTGFFHVYSLLLRDNSIVQYTGNGSNPNTSINPPTEPNVQGEQEFTQSASNEFDPAWSPNGSSLVFATDRHYRLNPGQGTQRKIFELYRLTLGGVLGTNQLTRLTAHKGSSGAGSGALANGSTGNPAYSPSGAQIVFESGDVTGVRQLYVIPAGGQALISSQWTRLTNQGAGATSPDYSPDGTKIVFSRANNVSVINAGPEASSNAARQLTTQGGITPSWGKAIQVTAAPTATPRPTATATPRPVATATPRPTATSGGTQQQVNLSPQSRTTIKRLSNGGVQNFPDFLIAGDHEVNGDRSLQAFSTYSLSTIPAGATIINATLSVLQNQQNFEGNPFSLGPLFVERAPSLALNEGALQTGAARVSSSFANFTSVNVTSLVQQARSQGTNVIFRFRFQQLQNNNGQNDNADLNTGGLEVTYRQ